MLRDTFGDMLFLPKSECLEELPSPENLRCKIIISTKPPEKLNKVSSVKEENNNSQSGKGWKLCSQLSLPLPLSFKRGGQELWRAKSDLPIDEDKVCSEMGCVLLCNPMSYIDLEQLVRMTYIWIPMANT